MTRVGVIACGALAAHLEAAAAERGLAVDVHPLPPLLHNRPERIAPAVAAAVAKLRGRYAQLAVAYADCGTAGALARVCAEHGLPLLRGAHCYDVIGGDAVVARLLEEEPGTYLLTDFLVRAYEHVLVRGLGLDRWPELRDDYFRHYRRVVWLAQRPTPELHARAEQAAAAIGLPLEVLPVGDARLAAALEGLVAGATSEGAMA